MRGTTRHAPIDPTSPTSSRALLALLITLTLALWIAVIIAPSAIASTGGNPRQQSRMHRVEQITPNPYDPTRGSTEIRVEIVRESRVELRIFSMDGTHIADVADQSVGAGTHSFTWDGRGEDGTAVSTGSYLCQLRVGDFVSSAIIIVVR